MRWIFLSPHLDDVVLSCGGLVWELVQSGSLVEIWTLFAGDPPDGVPFSPFAQIHHDRWQTGAEAVAVRREEDRRACARLGALPRYWVEPDCIYRRLPDGSWLVQTRDDLFTTVHPLEAPLVERLAGWLSAALANRSILSEEDSPVLVVPLTMGGHIDHRVVRAAAESLGMPLLYYPDYPYAVLDQADLAEWIRPEWREFFRPVSEAGLAAWQAAAAEFVSQISTFWAGEENMKAELRRYWEKKGGSQLWRSSG